jgi:hypothetical protein
MVSSLERLLFLGRKSVLFFIFIVVVALSEACAMFFRFSQASLIVWLALEYLHARLFPTEPIGFGVALQSRYMLFLHLFVLHWSFAWPR